MMQLPPSVSLAAESVRSYFGLLWHVFSHLDKLAIVPIRNVFYRQVYFTGVEAVGIVAVFGLLCGALVITQVTSFVGANSELTVKILIWTVVREVGPLFAAIIIIARSSAAIASELALMKTRQEFVYLQQMNIPPRDYLVVPRFAGVTLAVLALSIYFQIVAICGGLAISALYQNVSYWEQFDRFVQAITVGELVVVAIKGCLFGVIISSISCFNGMQAKASITEVPKVAIRAVLQSLLFVFVLDALIAYLGMAE